MVISISEQEKNNKKWAAIATAIICLILLLIMIFFIVWQRPDPPPPGVGFELNFGTVDQGSGIKQPKEPVGAQQVQEKVEEVQPEKSQEPVEEVQKSTPVQQEPVSKLESPVNVKKEEKKEPVKEPKKEVKEQPKKVEKEEPKKEEVKPKAETLYQPKGKANGEGDDKNKVGDKGDPRGVDNAAVYKGEPGAGGGGAGGAGGASLQLAGWRWDYIPEPKLPKNETGHIKFKIVVDENGYIIQCTPIDKALSPEAERIITQEIRKLTFSKAAGANVPNQSTGTIEYKIKSR